MNNDFPRHMTPLDQAISSESLQLMKLLIPYLPPANQRMLAVYVKFLEFQTVLSSFRAFRQLSNAPEDIFESLKPYLPHSALESFDNMMSMMSMVNSFQEMQDFDPMSMMQQFQKEGETHD